MEPLRAKGLEHSGQLSAFGSKVVFDSYRIMRYLVDEVFIKGTYEVGQLPDEPTIVDCGANVGVATWFFQWRYPGSTVIAVEPAPRSFELLAQNIETNGWNCSAFNEASAAEDGTIELSLKEGQTTTPSASMVPGRVTGDAVTVNTRRLSTRLPEHVDLLKVDVEGAESEVFTELEQAGALDRVDRLAVEYHHHIPGRGDDLPAFLNLLTRNRYVYTVLAEGRAARPAAYQDLMIHAVRP